ncbi:MAG: dUTP diphosphatase [Spiribacter salinus]|uniref:dUTP diphosphatase n=1 Tax=Spiribacter salinus TaxID=1335746 RepID=A0A540VTX9_9GAMM|nr:MAG: dUTP diphosphatase [Spiribacter salinus]
MRGGLSAPKRATDGAAGFDLRAAKLAHLEPEDWILMPTGFAWRFPPRCAGLICPRSGVALRHGLTVLNAPGVIDADFEGEVCVLLVNHGAYPVDIERGDRIAQLVVVPAIGGEATVVERVTAGSARGAAGFGSTGVA